VCTDMNRIFKDNKHFLLYTLKWMTVYIVLGFVAALIFPFPLSLVAALGGFMVVNFLRTRFMLKKMGISMKGLFGSIRSTGISPSSSTFGYNPIRYYCMSCGNEHKEIACPKCGSKMKKVG
jgi:hypothetical protein